MNIQQSIQKSEKVDIINQHYNSLVSMQIGDQLNIGSLHSKINK